MKILEEKPLPEYKVRCYKCDSLLSYTILDEQTGEYETPFEGWSTDSYIICPKCKTKIVVASNTEQYFHNWRIPLDDQQEI